MTNLRTKDTSIIRTVRWDPNGVCIMEVPLYVFASTNFCVFGPIRRNMYRLYHEVEVSTWFIHRGPEARGCVNHVGTDTEWYNRLVPWATWPWQRIYDLATIVSAIKGSSTYLATVQIIVADRRRSSWRPTSPSSCQRCFLPTPANSLVFRTTILLSSCTKASRFVDSNSK